jgi:hypothetical protein
MDMIHEHHRKRRSQGGDDSPVNVIGIPQALHDWIHANPEKAYETGLLVKSHDDPAEVKITLPDDLISVKKPRRKPNASTPDESRARKTTSIKTPKGELNVLPELIEECRQKLIKVGAMKYGEDGKPEDQAYFVITAVLAVWLQQGG